MNKRVQNISNIIEGLDSMYVQGKNMKELEDNLKKKGLYLDSADSYDMQYSKHFNDEKVTLYDAHKNEYVGTYNRYFDGGREIVNIKRRR